MDGENVETKAPEECSSGELLEINQSTRTFLRERFLKAMMLVREKECRFHMFDNANVGGTYLGMDVDLRYFLVSELQTPLGVIEAAKLRGQDTIWIHFPNVKCSDETSSEVQATPSEVQATPSEVQATPCEVQVTPSDVQATLSEVQATSSEEQATLSGVQATLSEVRVTPSEVQATASEAEVISSANERDEH